MLSQDTNKTRIKNNQSKLSTGSVDELKTLNSREVFGNMMVDIKPATHSKERQAVRDFLKNEFGDKYNFSESFVDKVIEKLRGV